MGFGLPAALGAQVAFPDELVIDIAGDGSFEMTLQELSTAQMYGLPVKVVILNNGYLGMVRQWQELFWEGRYAGTSFEPFQPDFARLAGAYGMPGTTVTTPATWRTPCARPSPTTGRRWSTCTSTRWPRSSRWCPRARGPDAMIVGAPRTGAVASGGLGRRLVELGDPHARRDRLGVEVHLLLEVRRDPGRQVDVELALGRDVGLVVGGEVGDGEAEHLVGVRVEVDRHASPLGDRRGVVVAAVDLAVGVGLRRRSWGRRSRLARPPWRVWGSGLRWSSGPSR